MNSSTFFRGLLSLVLVLCPRRGVSTRAVDVVRKVAFSQSGHLCQRYNVVTSVYRFSRRLDPHRNGIVDVYSTLHIGEPTYYQQLARSLHNYNFVLYELITSQDNVKETRWGMKQLKNRVFPNQQTTQLSKQLGLASQLSLNLQQPNWFLADLSSEEIAEKESQSADRIRSAYWLSVFGGRTFAQRLLDKFFIADQWLLWTLRTFSWLTPCPELSCLMIDWARMSPKAGGLSPLLLPMLDLVCRGRFQDARRLAFAQQLLSGLPDSGAWGGEAQSDIEVRIAARNSECCRTLASLLRTHAIVSEWQAHESSRREEAKSIHHGKAPHEEKDVKIAILYGAYHIEDLRHRLQDQLGFRLESPPEPAQYVAWSVESSAAGHDVDQHQLATRKDPVLLTPISKAYTRSLIIFSAVAVMYMFLGALDWWALVKIIADVVESATRHTDQSTALTDEWQVWPSLQWLVAYLVLYIQRHAFLLQRLSTVGLQWDRGLFADIA